MKWKTCSHRLLFSNVPYSDVNILQFRFHFTLADEHKMVFFMFLLTLWTGCWMFSSIMDSGCDQWFLEFIERPSCSFAEKQIYASHRNNTLSIDESMLLYCCSIMALPFFRFFRMIPLKITIIIIHLSPTENIIFFLWKHFYESPIQKKTKTKPLNGCSEKHIITSNEFECAFSFCFKIKWKTNSF